MQHGPAHQCPLSLKPATSFNVRCARLKHTRLFEEPHTADEAINKFEIPTFQTDSLLGDIKCPTPSTCIQGIKGSRNPYVQTGAGITIIMMLPMFMVHSMIDPLTSIHRVCSRALNEHGRHINYTNQTVHAHLLSGIR